MLKNNVVEIHGLQVLSGQKLDSCSYERNGDGTPPPPPTTRREGCEAVDICKTETKTQTQRTNMDTKGGNGNRTNWEITIDTYTPLTPHIKQITNENLLWSTGTLLSELW